jgi:CMP-N,N'-diacetyllegionaminic acid synthase
VDVKARFKVRVDGDRSLAEVARDPARPICLVLARGGSKGLPGKNTRPIAGKPCVRWTLDFALASRCRPLVALSSDDAGALEIARQVGALTITRPAALASDSARIDDAARHAASELDRVLCIDAHAASEARRFYTILYANVPVRPGDLLDRAVEMLRGTGGDSVQSYAGIGKYHPWWMARLDDAGQVRPWEGDVLNHGVFRRQDLPPAFVPDGGMIVVTRDALFGRLPGLTIEGGGPHAFFGVDRRGIITKPGEVIDIDDEIDLRVAEATLIARGYGHKQS